MCLWVFFLDNDNVSAILEMDADGLAEIIARILISVSLRSFTLVVHPFGRIFNIVVPQESRLEASSGHLEFWLRDTCEFALIIHQLDATPQSLKIFPVVHNLGDKWILSVGDMRLHHIVQSEVGR